MTRLDRASHQILTVKEVARERRAPSLAPWTREVELHAGPNPEITLTPVPDDVLAKL